MSKQYVLVNEKGDYVSHWESSGFKAFVTKTASPYDAKKFNSLEEARAMGKEITDRLHTFFGPEPYPATEKHTSTAQKIYPDASGTLIPDLRSQETAEPEKEETPGFVKAENTFISHRFVVPCRTCDGSVEIDPMIQSSQFPICKECLSDLKQIIRHKRNQ